MGDRGPGKRSAPRSARANEVVTRCVPSYMASAQPLTTSIINEKEEKPVKVGEKNTKEGLWVAHVFKSGQPEHENKRTRKINQKCYPAICRSSSHYKTVAHVRP